MSTAGTLVRSHSTMEHLEALQHLEVLRALVAPYMPAVLTEATASLRALRNCTVHCPSAQAALLEAGAPALLAGVLTSEALRSAPSAPTPLFRRVAWQALANLCAGHGPCQAAVWEAITAPSGGGGGGQCALECGATASASDAALASVVLGVAYTASCSACYGSDAASAASGGAAAACAARLERLCQHPVLLPALLRPCLPALGGDGGSAAPTAAAADVGLWCGLLSGALLRSGHFALALQAASRGLAAGELLAPAGAAPTPPPASAGHGLRTPQRWRVTAESTALVCATEAELEGARAPQTALLAPGLIASIPALSHFLTDACTQALAMAALLHGDGSSSSSSSGLDSGPLLLLPRLHLGLCLRAAEAAAGLLADACSASAAAQEDGGGAGSAAAAAAAQPALPSGTAASLLSLLAAATPLISSATAAPLETDAAADVCASAGGAASAPHPAFPPPPPLHLPCSPTLPLQLPCLRGACPRRPPLPCALLWCVPWRMPCMGSLAGCAERRPWRQGVCQCCLRRPRWMGRASL